MSHATVMVILRGCPPEEVDERVDEAMYPYWELDLSEGELRADPRAVFTVGADSTEEMERQFREDWPQEMEETVARARENGREYEPPTYENAEEWARNWHGWYRETGTDRWGYYDNPNRKWDWYQIGGRWAGLLKVKEEGSGMLGDKSFLFAARFNDGEEVDPYGENRADSATIEEIDPDQLRKLATYAVITPDGEWHEKARLGWFGAKFHEEESIQLPTHMRPDEVEELLDDFLMGEEFKAEVRALVDYLYDLEEESGEYTLSPPERQAEKTKPDIRGGVEAMIMGQLSEILWTQIFHQRFIVPLEPEDRLVIVDYHI